MNISLQLLGSAVCGAANAATPCRTRFARRSFGPRRQIPNHSSLSVGVSVERQKLKGAGKVFGIDTLPETNIAPENRPSQKETHLPTAVFQVLC